MYNFDVQWDIVIRDRVLITGGHIKHHIYSSTWIGLKHLILSSIRTHDGLFEKVS